MKGNRAPPTRFQTKRREKKKKTKCREAISIWASCDDKVLKCKPENRFMSKGTKANVKVLPQYKVAMKINVKIN